MKVDSLEGFSGERSSLITFADSVAALVDSMIPGDPPFGPRPLHLFRQGGKPRVYWDQEDFDGEHYRIELTPNEAGDRFAFQLAHELTHVKMGPARTNPLLETMANAVGLEVLDGHGSSNSRRRYVETQSREIDASFLDLSYEEKIQKLAGLRPGRAWQVVVADLVAENASWCDLLGLATHTEPSVQERPDYQKNLPLKDACIPSWIPTWLREAQSY